ncbi:hypothetical protein A3Q56_05434 [Intoshia linei]|uniref:D-lactate dehydrogenase (cytochrome) n=1 Tax=Intoshia linei TaxID=1819745 RepID=A0A177AXR5_9BILA|nr:hypothetical protein A3Q56_05434 [Intoshia linei]
MLIKTNLPENNSCIEYLNSESHGNDYFDGKDSFNRNSVSKSIFKYKKKCVKPNTIDESINLTSSQGKRKKPKVFNSNITIVLILVILLFIICQLPSVINKVFWYSWCDVMRRCGYFQYYYSKLNPGADACIGGMCGTNASGTHALKYGSMKENVLNLQVVLPNGEIIHTAGKNFRSKKHSAGYNLTNLFIGAEGTLGIITQATPKLNPRPEKKLIAQCSFKTIKDAIDASTAIMMTGNNPARIEFKDNDQDQVTQASNKYHKSNIDESNLLLFDFHGSDTTKPKSNVKYIGKAIILHIYN